MATLDRTVKVQLRNASVRVSPAVSARGLWQVTNVIKVLINPNTILLIWILYNSKSWMPKYFWFELLFVVIYCQNGNEDDVYVCIICIHNVLLQEKYYLIHMLMAYLNSIFYILSFFSHKSSSGLLYEMEERNRNAYIDVILITILEIQTSIWH